MKFTLAHSNINVCNLEKSLDFYKNALGMEVARRHKSADGSFEIAFISDGSTSHQVELTWLRDKDGGYNLGDNESHIAFVVDDIKEAHSLHEKMSCICYENESMGLYFIEDPDGYWIEIIPEKR
ncbi:MAG: VOC family protein [Oscillospiraceae bacterium]|nr:VOC family protein [Oscillospiraceae bacterium]